MTAEEYKQIFNQIKLPKEARLGPGVYVSDVEKFIESHLIELGSTKNKRQIEPLVMRLDRLLELIRNNELNELKF